METTEKTLKVLQEIKREGCLRWQDVTFARNSYPQGVGEYMALVGFASQQDAKLWAEETGGEFSLFYKENGWHLLSYRGRTILTPIVTLAGSYPVIFLEGTEDYYQLSKEIFGQDLIEYFKDIFNNSPFDDEKKESWIKIMIERWENNNPNYYPEDVTEEEEEEFDELFKEIRNYLEFLENFKGLKGYVVIDDVNGKVEGVYNNDYPAHYKEDNKNYIFGVLYKNEDEKINEITELIED